MSTTLRLSLTQPASNASIVKSVAGALCVAVALSGCALDEPLGDDSSVASEADVSDGGKADEAFDAIVAELTAKYGVRPRKYNRFFTNSNEAETRFMPRWGGSQRRSTHSRPRAVKPSHSPRPRSRPTSSPRAATTCSNTTSTTQDSRDDRRPGDRRRHDRCVCIPRRR